VRTKINLYACLAATLLFFAPWVAAQFLVPLKVYSQSGIGAGLGLMSFASQHPAAGRPPEVGVAALVICAFAFTVVALVAAMLDFGHRQMTWKTGFGSLLALVCLGIQASHGFPVAKLFAGRLGTLDGAGEMGMQELMGLMAQQQLGSGVIPMLRTNILHSANSQNH